MLRIAITATPSEARGAPLLLRGDLASAFRQAAECGCQGVELHLRRAEDVDVKTVQRLAAEYGLGVPTLGTGMAAILDGLTLADPDPEIRARALERVRGHIGLAAQLGSAVIIGSLSGRLAGRVPRAQALECLGQVCAAAAPLGVTVLLEPLNRYENDYINTLADGTAIIAELGAPNLKLLADTFHMNIEERDLAASLVAAGPAVAHVHLADSNRQAPGHGHLDLPGVLSALVRISYQDYLAFEILPLPDPLSAIRDGLEAIAAAQP